MLNFNNLEKMAAPYPYSEGRMKSLLILFNAASEEDKGKPKVQDKILEVFYMFSPIVIKQINNLFYLTRFSEIQNITRDEALTEAWIVFHRCVESFDPEMSSSFMFFFNTSLSRHFIRLKNKNNKLDKDENTVSVVNVSNDDIQKIYDFILDKSENNESDLIYYDLIQIELDFNEIRLFTSKFVLKETKKDFLLENGDFNEKKYYSVLTSLKAKIEEYAKE